MKWILLIVLLVIGPYTFLRWHYRKPQPAFEPYHDIKDRANTMRLVSAGWFSLNIAYYVLSLVVACCLLGTATWLFVRRIGHVRFEHVRRERNKEADRLANEAMDRAAGS